MTDIKRRPTRNTSLNGARSLIRVSITKEPDPSRQDQLREFVEKHIAEYGGRTEESRGIPLMIFEREQDAHRFADEVSQKLNIHRERIAVKAWK